MQIRHFDDKAFDGPYTLSATTDEGGVMTDDSEQGLRREEEPPAREWEPGTGIFAPPSAEELRACIQDAINRGDLTHSNQWENAVHEAGHVVVLVKVALSYPDSVYLSDDPMADHAGRMTGSFLLEARLDSPDDLDLSKLSAADRQAFLESFWTRRRQYGSVLAAGRIAESIAGGISIDVEDLTYGCLWDDDLDTDMIELRRLARTHDEKWLESVFVTAEETLRGSWAQVTRVAVALVERRSLDREALWELLEPTRRSSRG